MEAAARLVLRGDGRAEGRPVAGGRGRRRGQRELGRRCVGCRRPGRGCRGGAAPARGLRPPPPVPPPGPPRGRGPLGPCLPFRGSVHEGAARRSAAHPPTRTRGAFPVWDDLSFGADLRFGSLGRRRQTHAHVRGSQSRLQKRGALARPPFHVGG